MNFQEISVKYATLNCDLFENVYFGFIFRVSFLLKYWIKKLGKIRKCIVIGSRYISFLFLFYEVSKVSSDNGINFLRPFSLTSCIFENFLHANFNLHRMKNQNGIKSSWAIYISFFNKSRPTSTVIIAADCLQNLSQKVDIASVSNWLCVKMRVLPFSPEYEPTIRKLVHFIYFTKENSWRQTGCSLGEEYGNYCDDPCVVQIVPDKQFENDRYMIDR